ncbi:hypothetical protein BKA65DRAFT_476359 [Rhexocercosporidium sp. MPI-PUGE-AT-0058]|nr:hypothetical protein BKA65DRAFT_476359 [Rhexocercosporidium sp. MPI-PUGE-AT-0058]
MGTDIENAYDKLDLIFTSEPLLAKSGQCSSRSVRPLRPSLEIIELDNIPPIIKSANGNIFWADEQCTRRVGLTSTEARLFLKLLQTDQPESCNYDEYKQRFADFGLEQKRLQDLVKALPWWKWTTYRQKAIWKARIDWLKRMEEPRLWLLYFMARRKRILKKASVRVLEALKEKRRVKIANGTPHRGRTPQPIGTTEPIMLDDLSNIRQDPSSNTSAPPSQHPELVTETTQNPELKLRFAARLRGSFSTSRYRESHSRSSKGQCPVFTGRIEATREDIKRQVESIMPTPKPYIVVGWFLHSTSDPNERILQFDNTTELFQVLRKGESDCERVEEIPVVEKFERLWSDSILSQLFLAYKASYRHADQDVSQAWEGWVRKNLNDNKDNPLEGRYSLRLIYDWSSYRLSTVVAIPLLLSLAIGFWFMNGQGDVVTAWTISLYIVTAAAALIALMAIIGSLKDI